MHCIIVRAYLIYDAIDPTAVTNLTRAKSTGSSLISIISRALEYQQLIRLALLLVVLVRVSMELFGSMLKQILQVVVLGENY